MINQNFLGSYVISVFGHNRPTWIQTVVVEQGCLKKNLNFNM